MSRIPDFLKSLEQMKELHLKKNADYASEANPFDNFDVSEYLISKFKYDRDKVFVWPIATKLARLGNLLSSDNPPNNESIEDSFIDIANYILLWKADFLNRRPGLIPIKLVETYKDIKHTCGRINLSIDLKCPACNAIFIDTSESFKSLE